MVCCRRDGVTCFSNFFPSTIRFSQPASDRNQSHSSITSSDDIAPPHKPTPPKNFSIAMWGWGGGFDCRSLLTFPTFFLLYFVGDRTLTRSEKDLFNIQIGRVAKCSLAYGPQGVSKGVATIQFVQKGDGKRAYDRYDGKLIDNTRRLKVPSPPSSPPKGGFLRMDC
jgi:hypothetical protein